MTKRWRSLAAVVDVDVAAVAGVAAKAAFGSDELGQRDLDLLSNSLTAHALKSYAGKLFQLAEFYHDSKNISPLDEAATATKSRPPSQECNICCERHRSPIIRYQGGWATNSDVVLYYIDLNVLPSPGA
eukprot:jgi/Tetstr1/439223/TSEL_027665.t1